MVSETIEKGSRNEVRMVNIGQDWNVLRIAVDFKKYGPTFSETSGK